jgi:multidrug transporter EmrE-like cation transporter
LIHNESVRQIVEVGLALGACNTFLFARSIKAIPLSVAYPVLTGASFAFITVGAAVVFQERLVPAHLCGIGLVVAGIILTTATQAGS